MFVIGSTYYKENNVWIWSTWCALLIWDKQSLLKETNITDKCIDVYRYGSLSHYDSYVEIRFKLNELILLCDEPSDSVIQTQFTASIAAFIFSVETSAVLVWGPLITYIHL